MRFRGLARLASGILSLALSSSSAWSQELRFGDVTDSPPKGELKKEGETTKWVETRTLKNKTANEITVFVTSQPYDVKNPGEGEQVVKAVEQIQQVTIPANGEKTVTFEFVGAEAKKWKSFYGDVYKEREKRNLLGGASAGNYAFLQVPAGAERLFADTLEFIFPTVLEHNGLESAMFTLEVDELLLPSSWELTSLGPTTFSLKDYESQILTALFTVLRQPLVGEIAFVEFRLTAPDALPSVSWASRLGVEVVHDIPTPSMLSLVGVAGVGAALRMYSRRRKFVSTKGPA